MADWPSCPHIGRRYAVRNGWQCSNCGAVTSYTADDPAPHDRGDDFGGSPEYDH